ncbi:hypothetical protein [Hymenobacter arizonensis]|nr:hypothetical protein [Hymenobacter arizonensis]
MHTEFFPPYSSQNPCLLLSKNAVPSRRAGSLKLNLPADWAQADVL